MNLLRKNDLIMLVFGLVLFGVLQGMMEEAANPELKKALKDLAEAIHYSDVVSLPGLADVDARIAQNVAILQDELTDENADPLARIETLRRLLKERDRTAAILKR